MSKKTVLVAFGALLSTSCGPSSREPPADLLTAAQLGEQTILTNREYLQYPGYAAADLEWGARLAMQCRACHSFEINGPQLLGPNLHGVFGRPAGSVRPYPYSSAMLKSDFIWTPRAVDAFLTQPFYFLPGSQMAFTGMAREKDRDALIAFLLHETDNKIEVMENSE